MAYLLKRARTTLTRQRIQKPERAPGALAGHLTSAARSATGTLALDSESTPKTCPPSHLDRCTSGRPFKTGS